jgi:hypothetical protein
MGRQGIVLAAGEGRAYPMGRLAAVFKADGAETDGQYSISEWWLEPHTPGPGAHSPGGRCVLRDRRDLKMQPGKNIVKYGNGVLNVALMDAGVIDEFHLLLTPVAVGSGRHMFEDMPGAPTMALLDITRCTTGVVIVRYAPALRAVV